MDEKKKEKIVKYFRQMLNVYDFQLVIDINKDLENVFRLNDIQKGNLNGIEQEEFYTLADIIERLDSYHQDYIYHPLEMKQDDNIKLKKDDWDLVAKRYIENDTVANVLSQIHTKEYIDLITKKEKFEMQDIIKILDEDENFYKSVCKKYVGTMSKEMLLKIDNKILHIFIKDEYIDLKENGKINSKNYKDYLDGNFEVYEYNFYQELYNSTIKNEISYDLNDLELFDSNGKWNFYITFEELKKVGYGYMVKDQFTLIEKYALPKEKIFEFFDYFTLEQLEDFEKTLHLYYETDDMYYDKETLELHSKSNSNYNSNIICLAEKATTYEDFIEDYIEHSPTYYDISLSKVIEYFKENKIKNLLDYGSDRDEGLYNLSSMYKEVIDKLNVKYFDVSTRDKEGSDGKFITTILFEDKTEIEIETSAWNGIKAVTENVLSIYETYEKLREKMKSNEVKNENEFEYDFN